MNTAAIQAIREIKQLDMQTISEIVAALSNQVSKCAGSHLKAHQNAVEMLDDITLYLRDEIDAEERLNESEGEEELKSRKVFRQCDEEGARQQYASRMEAV